MARECYYLSVEEKDAFLAAHPSCEVVSAPHNSQEECEAVCASATGTGTSLSIGGGILVDCCENDLPAQVTMTFITTLCNVSKPAIWDADLNAYVADISSCQCIGGTVNLICQDGYWYLTGAVNIGPGTLESCNPLQITFAPAGSIGGCGGSLVVITE